MTREQCEREVIKKMREIQELVTEYMGQSPEFISAYYHGGHNSVSINNDYHTGDLPDAHKPIWAYDSAQFPYTGVDE